jgi:hypothetical protein
MTGAVRYIVPRSAYQDVDDLRAENRREPIRRWQGTAVNVCGTTGRDNMGANASTILLFAIPFEPQSPAQASNDPFAVNGCPSGWFCFYKDINFNGRRLQVSDCSLDGVTQYLTTYGFGNQISSWVVNDTIFG